MVDVKLTSKTLQNFQGDYFYPNLYRRQRMALI